MGNAVESIIKGFTKSESGVIKQVQNILESSGLSSLKDAFKKGEFTEVDINGTKIAFDPEIPTGKGYFGITNGKDGFILGGDAFQNSEELTKTVLHEMHRLNFSEVVQSGSASGSAASSTTQSASDFVNKVYDEIFKQ